MKKIYFGLAALAIIIVLGVAVYYLEIKDPVNGDHSEIVIPFSENGSRWGLVTTNGNIIVNNEWDVIPSIATEGIVRVKNKNGNFEFFSVETNPTQIGDEYKQATLFSKGMAAVVNSNGDIQYINKSGEVVFDLIDDGKGNEIIKAGLFSEGLARFQSENGLWGFINTNGAVAIPPIYSLVENFSDGVALVERYDEENNVVLKGFIGPDGTEAISLDDRYTKFKSFSEGLAPCTDRDELDQWGYIDKNGNRVIEISPERKSVEPFRGGVAPFFNGEYWGLINETGEKIINPRYDENLRYFHNGLAPFKGSEEKIGYMNSARETVIECQYEEVLPFYTDFAIVKNEYYYFIDATGTPLPEYYNYIPLNEIKSQYENYKNELVRNLHISASGIVNSWINEISAARFNDISYATTPCNIIEQYNLDRQILPANSYEKSLNGEFVLDETTRFEVFANFEDPVQTNNLSGQLSPNCNTNLMSIEYNLDISEFDQSIKAGINSAVIDRIKQAGFEESGTDEGAEISTFKNKNTVIKTFLSQNVFALSVDYSGYY